MKHAKPGLKYARLHQWTGFGFLAAALLGSAVAILVSWPQPSISAADTAAYPPNLRQDYSSTVKALHDFEQRQRNMGIRVVSVSDLNRQLSAIQLDATAGQYHAAGQDLASLKQSLANWNLELGGGAGQSPHPNGLYLPILLYHYPPPNFEEQLVHLEQAGYTTIDLKQALAGLHGGPLPAKPVVITFDDGFAAQDSAVTALIRHKMKATFYIINGGEASQWCIGAGRRYGDPLQPPGGCGDAYMSWDQVRALDRTGLITIGGHTINHPNLPSLPIERQRQEIAGGKAMLETQLGHSIRDFAYPYGAYNDETIALAKEAGYLTATTVMPGEVQPPGSEYSLRRVRDAMLLP